MGRRIFFMSCSVRKMASTHARRLGLRNSRTASLSRSMGNSSFAREMYRETGSQRFLGVLAVRPQQCTVRREVGNTHHRRVTWLLVCVTLQFRFRIRKRRLNFSSRRLG